MRQAARCIAYLLERYNPQDFNGAEVISINGNPYAEVTLPIQIEPYGVARIEFATTYKANDNVNLAIMGLMQAENTGDVDGLIKSKHLNIFGNSIFDGIGGNNTGCSPDPPRDFEWIALSATIYTDNRESISCALRLYPSGAF